jgi:diphthamide synthase subunit DPH2
MASLTAPAAIDETAAFLAAVGATRVALQFPDELLSQSPGVVRALTAALRKQPAGTTDGGSAAAGAARLAVLGDTSFGACCVDEVAAAHMPADAVVHYGPSCLSPPSALPVLHVFDDTPLAVDTAAAAICRVIADGPAGGAALPALLLFDTSYAHAVPDVLAVVARWRGVAAGYTPVEVAADADAAGAATDAGTVHDALTRRFTVRLRSPLPAQLAVPSYCRVAFPPPASPGGDAASGAVATGCASGAGACGCGDTTVSQTDTGCCGGGAGGSDSASAADGGCCRRSSTSGVATTAALAGSSSAAAAADPAVAATGGVLRVLGMTVPLPPRSCGGGEDGSGDDSTSARDARTFSDVLYIGHRPSRLRAVVAQFAGAGTNVWQWDPRGSPAGAASTGDANDAPPPPALELLSASASRLMSRRYRVIEGVRGAGVVGIIAGTLGVSRHNDIIAAVRTAAAAAGKAAYTFLVGKLAAVKLGNFPEVDAWVLVACPECSLLEEAVAAGITSPLATPQEALIALLGDAVSGGDADDGTDDANADARPAPSSLVWTGASQFDFPMLLADAAPALAAVASKGGAAASAGGGSGDGDDDGRGAFFSLVSGGPGGGNRIVQARPWAVQTPHEQQHADGGSGTGDGDRAASPPPQTAPASTALTVQSASRALAAAASGPNAGAGAAYLAGSRQWRGLAYDYSDALVEAGPATAATPAAGAAAGGAPAYDGESEDADGTDPAALALALAAYQPQAAATVPSTAVLQGAVGRAAGYTGEGGR